MISRELAYASAASPPHEGGLAFGSTEVRYRPEIDGLRALAVVPVVLFHAGFRSFSGGYVGVDVFFVISGFLITSILAREIDGGRYSILEFYRRRVLRIFPALAAVELATLAAAYFILTPSEYVDLAKSAAAVSVFSSNIYFWKSVSYFQSASAFQPLLHTWSLAVEEQYYLFFPLLLRLLSPHRSAIRAALWFILLGSLCLAILLVATKPDLAFYLLPTRAWELMLGGLTAIGNLPKPSNARFASGASLVGVALIVAPMVFYTAATPFPGITALPPTIGTALIIWSGRMGVVSQTLSRGPIVLLGRASYSIYLWHLPLIAFAAYLAGGEIPTELALFLCAASVGLGLASLVLIERPFRSYREKRDQLAVLACIGMVAVALVSGLIVASRGLPGRLEPYDAAIAAASDDKYRHHAECMTVDRFIVYPDHACHLGSPNTPATVLLWGDSHAMVTATALEQAALHRHASFLFAADADCPPGVGFDIDPHFDPGLTSQLSYRYCAEYNLRMLKLALTSPMLHTVVLSSRWTNWRIGALPNRAEAPADVRLRDASGTASSLAANRAKWERGFLTLIARLAAANKHVVIVGPIPEPNFDVPRQLHIERFGFVRPSGPITEGQYRQRHRVILTFFSELQRMRNVSFIWPYDALCKEDRCPLVESGHPMFFDQDHLSVFGARKTAYLYDGLFN